MAHVIDRCIYYIYMMNVRVRVAGDCTTSGGCRIFFSGGGLTLYTQLFWGAKKPNI